MNRTGYGNNEDSKLLYRIAKCYYEQELTQLEIGNKFGLSRIKVSRLLKKAQSTGIVKIHIYEPKSTEIVKLEEIIEQKYGLDEVIIADTTMSSYQDSVKRIGYEAANYLDRILSGEEIICLGWGNTILSLVDALPNRNFYNMKIVQLMGGLGSPELEMFGTNLLARAAFRLGAKEYLLASPGVLSSKTLREEIINDPQISATISLASSADIAIFGLGSPGMTLPAISAGIILESELTELQENGAVGDICLQFINSKGKIVNSDLNSRVVALPLEKIKKIPKVVGVAAGVQKTEITKAALMGGYLDVLIVDSLLGEKLIKC